MEADTFKKLQPQTYLRSFLEKNVRPDGRAVSKIRTTTISSGVITTADGSSLVKIGHSSVVAGIKAVVEKPADDSPDKGKIVVAVDFPALCAAKFKQARPQDLSHAVSQLLERTLIQPEVCSLSDLVVESGFSVWALYLDVVCLDYDGSVFDAALIASIAALENLRLSTPLVANDGSHDVSLNREQKVQALPIRTRPIPLTFGTFESYVLTDLTNEEEEIVDGQFTVVRIKDRCALQKWGGAAVADDTIRECFTRTDSRANELQLVLDQAAAQFQQRSQSN
eukprot:GILJ01002552.1.p1 GENE.GILJ01002552.1~~GILJ01002552.1.p1  ORF type:complete len:296 (-),score=52.03 GILJ01002552.1:145-987(-)